LGIGSLLDAKSARLIHEPQVGHGALPGAALGAKRFDQSPIRLALAMASTEIGPEEHAPMLAAIRQAFFHYTPLRTKYLDSSRPIATVQRLTAKKLGKLAANGNFVRRLGKLG
jgi:hypothetical protein